MSREMKDSGIEWIGEIPNEWEIVRLKQINQLYTGNSISDNEKDRYSDQHNAYPYISTKDVDVVTKRANYANGMYVKKDDNTFKIAPQESTLLCVEGGSAGKKITFTNQEVAFGNKLCCINSDTQDNKFVYYYLNSPAFTEEFSLNISGLIGGVSIGILRQFSMPLPSIETQVTITNYLNYKVPQIDIIIQKQTQLIEEYKIYKQSLITETVTKGLNPNVEMKDSGIEWIGMVPKNWNVSPIKRWMKKITDGAHISPDTENGVYNFVSVTDIKNGKINFEECLKTSKENFGYLVRTGCQPISNDVLLSKDGTVGKSVVVDEDYEFVVASSLIIFRPKGYIDSRYLHYLFRSDIIQKQLGTYLKGTGLKRVSIANAAKMLGVLPLLEEQCYIASYLDKKCKAIDSLLLKKQSLIQQLEAYKKSLIYECVTGKREIPSAYEMQTALEQVAATEEQV